MVWSWISGSLPQAPTPPSWLKNQTSRKSQHSQAFSEAHHWIQDGTWFCNNKKPWWFLDLWWLLSNHVLRSLLSYQDTRKMSPQFRNPPLRLVPNRRKLTLTRMGAGGDLGIWELQHCLSRSHVCFRPPCRPTSASSQYWHTDLWPTRLASTAMPGGGRVGCRAHLCMCSVPGGGGGREGPRIWTWACLPHLCVAPLSDRCTWTPHRLPICYETMVTIAHLQGAVLLRSSISDMKEIISGARKGSLITENISAFMHWSLPWSNSSDMVFFNLLLYVYN